MSRGKLAVHITRNFELDLQRIERWQDDFGSPGRFDAWVDDLLTSAVPLLQQTPGVGAPYSLNHLSGEVRFIVERVLRHVGANDLRRLVRGELVILYAISPKRVNLLAVRHHREANFRF